MILSLTTGEAMLVRGALELKAEDMRQRARGQTSEIMKKACIARAHDCERLIALISREAA